MKIKKMSAAVIILVAALLAVASVAASSGVEPNTPLYTLRMEQASSEMKFLPTGRNTFVYTSEKGCTLNYNISGGNFAEPLSSTLEYTCRDTCQYTCYVDQNTCANTCWDTCDSQWTCWYTCFQYTCITCYATFVCWCS
jgi:hypothetical protein